MAASIGRVLLIPKGTYSGSATYNQLDWVRYNGVAWVCKVNGTSGITPAEGDNWTVLAQDGTVSGSVDWVNVTNKPFDDVDSSDFDVDGNDKLLIKRGTFGSIVVASDTVTASGNGSVKFVAGSNVSISVDDTQTPPEIEFSATGGGGGGASWGSITGTLSNQTDLQNALNAKADSGSIPTDLDDLTDVTITGTPTQGQALIANSSGIFENAALPSGTFTVQQNGTTKGTSTANQSTNTSANIVTDEWHGTTATVSSGSFSFSGLDDTKGYGFKPFVQVDGNSTNKNPSAQISSISGAGTSNMSVTYSTDADNGATVKLRIIK